MEQVETLPKSGEEPLRADREVADDQLRKKANYPGNKLNLGRKLAPLYFDPDAPTESATSEASAVQSAPQVEYKDGLVFKFCQRPEFESLDSAE